MPRTRHTAGISKGVDDALTIFKKEENEPFSSYSMFYFY